MEERYNEISLMELLKYLLKYWWMTIIFTSLAVGISYYVTQNYITPIYESKTTLFIGKESGSLAGINLQELNVNDRLVVDYRELIHTNQVVDEVIRNLNLNTTASKLRKIVKVSTVNDSRFIYVSVKNPNPEVAQMIANEFSIILKDKAEEIIGAKNIYIVDEAALPKKPVSPRLVNNMVVGGLVGIFASNFLAFIFFSLKSTISTEAELEKVLNLPVIGVIPKFKGEGR